MSQRHVGHLVVERGRAYVISERAGLPRQLKPADGRSYLVGGTTTLILARRMLAATKTVRDHLPPGFDTPSPMQILMQLYVAEEESDDLFIADIVSLNPTSAPIIRRWLAALGSIGYVEQRGELVALTEHGYDRVIATLEAMFAAQRELD